MQGKTARIWRVFGGKRDNSRQKSRFREWKVARKPGMLTHTTLLKCMRSSWQFPFKVKSLEDELEKMQHQEEDENSSNDQLDALRQRVRMFLSYMVTVN